MIPDYLLCPICQSPLSLGGRTLICQNGHSFDQAKQGYWNLLPVQQKRSKDPGDNPEMVRARSQFLDREHYAPLRERIASLSSQLVRNNEPSPRVLDIGCGEGYYTSALTAANDGVQVIGLDISKHAIKAACKRSKAVCWTVATGANIPVPEKSQDLLVLMFSRLMPEPFKKVLKPSGHLLLVWPAERHLIELRQTIYDEVRPSQYDPETLLESTFSITQRDLLSFTFTLTEEEELNALLMMTPHSQRISQEKQAELKNKIPFTLTFEVNIGVFAPL